MEHTSEDPHHARQSHQELESQQLLPPTSAVQTNANSLRTQHASVYDVTSQSILTSGNGGEPGSGNANTGSWRSHGSPQWTPFVLRWYFVMVPAILATVCTIVVATLYWASHKNNGLGPESSAMPGWKFVPTLIAVIYTQLTSMILGAMKRTEPFARLAKPLENTPISRYTLLEKSKPWWTTLSHSFQKKRHGGSRNWALMASCIVYILAILGVSPISAALLGSREVRQARSENFDRLVIRNNSALRPRADRNTYLRTTGAILQNYSTSPWITDEYLVLPFWHSDLPQVESPWNFRSLRTNSWEANTTVFRNDFVCTDLHLSKKDMYLRNAIKSEDFVENEEGVYNKTYLASVLLESDHGCRFNLTVNATHGYGSEIADPSRYWMSWTDAHRIMFRDAYSRDAVVRLNEECPEDEVIILSTPWWKYLSTQAEELWSNLTMQAYACHTDYTMATIPVRITGMPENQSVQFDEDLFRRVHTPISSAMIDFRELHNIYTDVVWRDFVPQKGSDFGGPAAVLARGYNFSVPAMMADSNLLARAIRFRRRFFAEIIGATLRQNLTNVVEQQRIAGVLYTPARQVLVSGQAAAVLCTLLIISICALLAIMWWSRPTRRNLGLYCDPSMVLGVSLWASGNPHVLSSFRTLDVTTRQSLKESLTGRLFATDNGVLHEVRKGSRSKDKPLKPLKAASVRLASEDEASILPELRLRIIGCLLLYIVGLLTGMVVLFQFARRSELYQAFFTYRANVKLFGNANTISPFAIVPTVLAVVIALWWESLDSTCRTVQPYVSMYRGAKRPHESIGLSYASSFWLWASFNALRNRHWVLSLVTATTFLIQICEWGLRLSRRDND
jgi:hypothetical protein